jgi:hypothetical protein
MEHSPANPDNPNSSGAVLYNTYPKWIIDRFLAAGKIEFNEGTGFGNVLDDKLKEMLVKAIKPLKEN